VTGGCFARRSGPPLCGQGLPRTDPAAAKASVGRGGSRAGHQLSSNIPAGRSLLAKQAGSLHVVFRFWEHGVTDLWMGGAERRGTGLKEQKPQDFGERRERPRLL